MREELMTSRLPVLIVATIAIALSPIALGQVRNDELYRSIGEGRDDAFRAYLDAGGELTAALFVPESEFALPLFELALRAGNDEVAVRLLRAGVRPDVGLADLTVAEMFEAVTQKDMTDTLEFLLGHDPELLASIGPENHPLLHAVSQGSIASTSMILEAMAELSVVGYGDILNEALIVATSGDSPAAEEIAKALLAAGADPVSTPVLPGAAISCSPEMVDLFIQAGSDPNQRYIGKSTAEYAVSCLERQSRAARTILHQLKAGGVNLCSLDPSIADQAVAAMVWQIGQCE